MGGPGDSIPFRFPTSRRKSLDEFLPIFLQHPFSSIIRQPLGCDANVIYFNASFPCIPILGDRSQAMRDRLSLNARLTQKRSSFLSHFVCLTWGVFVTAATQRHDHTRSQDNTQGRAGRNWRFPRVHEPLGRKHLHPDEHQDEQATLKYLNLSIGRPERNRETESAMAKRYCETRMGRPLWQRWRESNRRRR
jgi:hypothetical protein